MKRFGLIGFPLIRSFSPSYFRQKFEALGLPHVYRTHPMETLEALRGFIDMQPDLVGLNVTIPHKQTVLQELDALDATAEAVGAVNTIVIKRQPHLHLTGYNTDVIGFERSLLGFIGNERPAALVLGTGGAAKAVVFVLQRLGISYVQVSRTAAGEVLAYEQLNAALVAAHPLIINTTPLGMAPLYADLKPDLPYEGVGAGHFLYDLVYHSEVTPFLAEGLARGAKVKNGLEMLHLQADAAWELWQG
ncbi:MAG: shikimate dehydrogenase [Sphingobacteriaceae bacterium]|nr:shikimate dehydrogenase [Sphingobacteriaceae bacterium]